MRTTQDGNHIEASTTQIGDENSTITSQLGNGNKAWTTQNGDQKRSYNETIRMHNDSKIAQLGDNNFGRVVQENGLQMSMVNQYGNSNSVTVYQD
jgi:hypothetical protein